MLGVGWGEMAVIGLVALLVVGPDKFPEMAKTIGYLYRQLRWAAHEAGATLSAEANMIAAGAQMNPKRDAPPPALWRPSLEDLKKAAAARGEPAAAELAADLLSDPESPGYARVERENA